MVTKRSLIGRSSRRISIGMVLLTASTVIGVPGHAADCSNGCSLEWADGRAPSGPVPMIMVPDGAPVPDWVQRSLAPSPQKAFYYALVAKLDADHEWLEAIEEGRINNFEQIGVFAGIGASIYTGGIAGLVAGMVVTIGGAGKYRSRDLIEKKLTRIVNGHIFSALADAGVVLRPL